MTNWKQLLNEAFEKTGDNFNNIATTLTYEELNELFDDGFGGHEGVAFTAWSDEYVYFPVVYDGKEWVGYAPRNPCDIKTKHQGGE